MAAGGNVSIQVTGAGRDSTLTVQGSFYGYKLHAKRGCPLQAGAQAQGQRRQCRR